jgi:hypothetical protein
MIRKYLFSLLTAGIILFLSLTGSDSFDGVRLINIPYFDKIAHFGMYFTFMSALFFETRNKKRSLKSGFILSVIPFIYGISMEICQELFTVSRTGSIFDVIFNSAGILVSILIWNWYKPFGNNIIK